MSSIMSYLTFLIGRTMLNTPRFLPDSSGLGNPHDNVGALEGRRDPHHQVRLAAAGPVARDCSGLPRSG